MSHACPTLDHAPRAALDAEAVRAAYRRWAGVYDFVFGGVSAMGRRRAVAEVNRLPGARVLEVGVGTGSGVAALRGEQADHRDRPVGGDARACPHARRVRAALATSRRCWKWTPRRRASPTAPSISRSRCSWRRSCRNPTSPAGGNAPRGAARRPHPVRQPFRRGARAALVAGARPWRRLRARSAGIRISASRRC